MVKNYPGIGDIEIIAEEHTEHHACFRVQQGEETMLRCSFKWDGCMDLWFNETNVHFCEGKRSTEALGKLLTELCQDAFDLMGRDPDDV